MSKKKPATLTIEPFPTLEWDDYCWSATIKLSAWEGFQCRLGPYASRSSRKPSDGTVQILVATPGDKAEVPPSPEQAAAFLDLIANQVAVRDSILQSVFREYPEYRSSYIADYDLEESDATLPVLERPEQLRDLIGISSLLIHHVVREGIAYVGYEFGCVWEEEHGLGAMMHRERVVSVGHADEGILAWIAEKDAEPPRK